MHLAASTTKSRRAIDLLVVAAFTLLGWSALLEAEHTRDVGFLLHYATSWGRAVLAFLRGGA